MTTLTARHGAAQAEYVASLLAPEKVRREALSCLIRGTAPETLRTAVTAACPDLEPVWRAHADEIELLAAHGVTGHTARDAAKIALVLNRTAGSYRRPGIYPGMPAVRRRMALIADEMDALAAEGFDPAAYAREIDQALGGAR